VPVRLAIVGLPQLLADLIADVFADDAAMHIDQLPDDPSIDLTDGAWAAYDAVIVGVSDPWCSQLVNQISTTTRPTLLGVRTDGRDSWIYRMQPRPHRLGPTSPAQIRATVLAGREPPP
jgi:hypothetical protein